MSDNVRTEAELRLKYVSDGLEQAVNGLIQVRENGDLTEKQVDALERSAVRLNGRLKDVSGGAKDGASGLKAFANSGGDGGKNAEALANHLPKVRYALYDVSSASAIAGAALLGAGAIVEHSAIQYESLFANVARTATGLNSIQLDNLKSQLLDITSQIPVTFDAVTQIATLGNQLNVPSDELSNFTAVTAKFAATTNVSAETAGTAFGRLGQILHDNDYKGLGDDIAYLGVKSVATESQIIALAQGIGVTTDAAGFSAKQTIALSTAMASLGTQPEAARGTILRVFADISNAVSQPGAKLNEFAAISHQSSTDFAKNWKTDASGAFTSFIKGLGSTADVNQSLAALGITATRDQQAIKLLANNADVLTSAQNNTAKSADYLDKSFQHISDTTASKLTVAQNNVKRLFSEIGESTSGPVAAGVDAFNSVLEHLTSILNNPIAAGGVGISLGITAIAGVTLIAMGAFFRYVATVAAVRSAQTDLATNGGLLKGSLSILTGSYDKNTAAAAKNSGATEANAAAHGVAASEIAAANTSQAGSTAAATASTGKLTSALGKAGLIGSLLALIPVIPAVVQGFNDWNSKALGYSDTVEGLTNKILGLANAATKVKATDALNKILDDTSAKYSTNGNPYDRSKTISGAQAYYNQQKTGETVPGKTISYFAGGAGINSAAKDAGNDIKSYDQALAALANSGNQKAVNQGIKLFISSLESQGLSQKEARSLLEQTNVALGLNADGSKKAAAASKESAAAADEQATAFSQTVSDLYSATNAASAVQQDFTDLGTAFYTNGAAAAANGPEIQKAISDIYASTGGGPAAAAQMQTLFDALVQGGFASADQLSQLSAVIQSLTGGKPVADDPSLRIGNLAAGYKTAATAAAKAAKKTKDVQKEVRTLVDYANDLSTVFQRAFDIRFGADQGLDTIASGWEDIRKNAADAADAMSKANATLQQLAADRKIDEYWLKIAKMYGDTLRASKIQADLAQNSQDTADAQKDLSDAQTGASKSLEGNSEAAIANRAALLGLVGNYQDYITSLASSGLSQDQLRIKTAQLKQDFIAQATQMGFSRDAVMRYASAFDDMTTAINRVPRNITVSASADPAIQALNELKAKIQDTTNNGAGYNIPITSSYDPAAAAKAARGSQLQAQLSGIQAQYEKAVKSGSDNVATRLLQQINDLSGKINSGNYWTGGYTGAGGKYDYAGNVHKGEFVFDSAATRNAGPGNLAKLQGALQSGKPFAVNGGGGGRPTGPLDLAPSTIDAIANAVSRRPVIISGAQVAHATSVSNVNNSNRGAA